MDDAQALHLVSEPLRVTHANAGEREHRLLGEIEACGRGKVTAMAALVDEIA